MKTTFRLVPTPTVISRKEIEIEVIGGICRVVNDFYLIEALYGVCGMEAAIIGSDIYE